MNRLLVLVVLILIPIAIYTNKEEVEVMNEVVNVNTLEIPLKNDTKNVEVLVSSNKDKSDAKAIDIDEYVIGVVAGEMPASFNMEALKAQAVAARTFALYKQKNVKDYVLSTSVSDQVYLTKEEMQKKWKEDYQYYYDRVKSAVMATSNEVITYEGDIIIAYYFAISNGYTEDAKDVFNESRAYLVPTESSWDKNYSSYTSSRIISKEAFLEKMGISNPISFGEIKRNEHNYVEWIMINGTKFTGLEVFRRLSLKSTDFTFIVEGDNIRIVTYGFGHGVGMSQYGAQSMANLGKSYKEILTHYYKNTEISKI